MLDYSVHPTIRLISWLLLLIVIQQLSGVYLLLAIAVIPVFGVRVIRRGVRLVLRARWLLFSLFVVFAWGVAGEPLWDGPVSPTFEGLNDAWLHLGRLGLTLFSVALFLELMPLATLLAATHGLLKPLGRLGLDPDRSVVRLMLVLRYVETLPRPRDWRTLLACPPIEADEQVVIDHQALRWPDLALVCLATLVVVQISLV